MTFPDGGRVTSSLTGVKVYGLFMGEFGSQNIGKQTFRDEENELECTIEYGYSFFKKQDYIYGEIKESGKKVCEVTGNYMGYLEFDKERYWDVREKDIVYAPIVPAETYLDSDSRNRTDGQFLVEKPV